MNELSLSPKTHGGRRAGSGRKPRNTVGITLRLSPETISLLVSATQASTLTKSELAEEILKEFLEAGKPAREI